MALEQNCYYPSLLYLTLVSVFWASPPWTTQDTPIIRDFGYRDAQNIGLLNWSANTNLLAPEINETLLHFLKSIIHSSI